MLKSGEWNRVVSHKIRWIPLRAMDFLCPIYVSRESCWKRLQLSHAPRHLRVVSEHLLGLSWCHRRACTTRAWICLVLIISTVETNQDKGCFSIVAKYYNVGGAPIRAAAQCFAVKSTSSKGFSYENVIEPFFSCHQFSSSTWHDREISLSHIL